MLNAKHVDEMVRKAPIIAAKLQELLDERDHLRIKISLAGDQSELSDNVVVMRRRVIELDRAIINHRTAPDAS